MPRPCAASLGGYDHSMKRVISVAALVVACGAGRGGPSGGISSSALVTGDTCALHQDAVTCRADPQGCAWYPNTRPCRIDQPCPAGWCYLQQSGSGAPADGGISASAGCACSSGSGDVCMLQVGGTAVQSSSQPAIACVARPVGCSATDPCSCLAQGAIERCWSSDQVTGLCICDNGIR